MDIKLCRGQSYSYDLGIHLLIHLDERSALPRPCFRFPLNSAEARVRVPCPQPQLYDNPANVAGKYSGLQPIRSISHVLVILSSRNYLLFSLHRLVVGTFRAKGLNKCEHNLTIKSVSDIRW